MPIIVLEYHSKEYLTFQTLLSKRATFTYKIKNTDLISPAKNHFKQFWSFMPRKFKNDFYGDFYKLNV